MWQNLLEFIRVRPYKKFPSMTTNLPSLYDPFSTEAKWQKFWEEKLLYKVDPKSDGEAYSIMIPPPNVTGKLHMGHALDNTLIDCLVR